MSILSNGEKVTVRLSKGKCLRLKIDGKTAEVVLYLPKRISVGEAEKFVASKSEWIKASRQKVLARIAKATPKDGHAIIFGENIPVVREDTRYGFIDGIIYLPNGIIDYDRALNGICKQQLATYISQKLPYFEDLTGLSATSWRLRKMTSRWGSCNTATGVITFSLMLLQKPKQVVDYVILHEIAHLKYPDHQAGFKAYVARFMPNWKILKKQLNEVYCNENENYLKG